MFICDKAKLLKYFICSISFRAHYTLRALTVHSTENEYL